MTFREHRKRQWQKIGEPPSAPVPKDRPFVYLSADGSILEWLMWREFKNEEKHWTCFYDADGDGYAHQLDEGWWAEAPEEAVATMREYFEKEQWDN